MTPVKKTTAAIMFVAITNAASASPFTSLAECEKEVAASEELLLNTPMENDYIVRLASAIDEVRKSCQTGELAATSDALTKANDEIKALAVVKN